MFSECMYKYVHSDQAQHRTSARCVCVAVLGPTLGHDFIQRTPICQRTSEQALLVQLELGSFCYPITTTTTTTITTTTVICQTTGPQPLPKRFLHLMRSRASSFKWEYPLLSPRSSSNFLRLLPRLLVTSICPCIFPSITCFRWQFLRKMWPITL
jgi:hypothetical protein